MEIATKHSFLRASITDSIIEFCARLKQTENGLEIFKNDVLPHINTSINKKLNEMSAEEFFLLIGLRHTFPVNFFFKLFINFFLGFFK